MRPTLETYVACGSMVSWYANISILARLSANKAYHQTVLAHFLETLRTSHVSTFQKGVDAVLCATRTCEWYKLVLIIS